MKRALTLLSVVTLVVASAAFAGTALADHGNGDKGKATQSSSSGHQGDGQDNGKAHDGQVGSGGATAHTTASTPKTRNKVTTSTTQSHKVLLCHATGSKTNPYVLISIDVHALKAHLRHQDGRDIYPVPAGGCPSAPGGGGTTTVSTTTLGTTTATQGTTTVSTTTLATTTLATTTVGTTTNTVPTTTGSTTVALASPGGSSDEGGVLGVTKTLKSPRASGGVLGATTRVARTNLPFTGFPLWAVALIAAGLVAMGLGLRRRGTDLP
jgi:hypothetical protein